MSPRYPVSATDFAEGNFLEKSEDFSMPADFENPTTGSATIDRVTEIPIEGLDFNVLVNQFETQLITLALERTNGNKKAAARLLSLNRTTLVEKIKKKGLQFGDCPTEIVELQEGTEAAV